MVERGRILAGLDGLVDVGQAVLVRVQDLVPVDVRLHAHVVGRQEERLDEAAGIARQNKVVRAKQRVQSVVSLVVVVHEVAVRIPVARIGGGEPDLGRLDDAEAVVERDHGGGPMNVNVGKEMPIPVEGLPLHEEVKRVVAASALPRRPDVVLPVVDRVAPVLLVVHDAVIVRIGHGIIHGAVHGGRKRVLPSVRDMVAVGVSRAGIQTAALIAVPAPARRVVVLESGLLPVLGHLVAVCVGIARVGRVDLVLPGSVSQRLAAVVCATKFLTVGNAVKIGVMPASVGVIHAVRPVLRVQANVPLPAVPHAVVVAVVIARTGRCGGVETLIPVREGPRIRCCRNLPG